MGENDADWVSVLANTGAILALLHLFGGTCNPPYTTDGASWQCQPLALNPATGRYELTVTVPPAGNFQAFVEALDNAGNATIETGKGTLFGLNRAFMPIIRRR
jgi:hypothetical protein